MPVLHNALGPLDKFPRLELTLHLLRLFKQPGILFGVQCMMFSAGPISAIGDSPTV
jgi:hypothetical protein